MPEIRVARGSLSARHGTKKKGGTRIESLDSGCVEPQEEFGEKAKKA